MSGPRILHLDIETAPLQSYHWGLWQQNIGLNMIVNEWSVLSYCAWWESDSGDVSKVKYNDVRNQDNFHDDSILLSELWELLNDADFVVAQNGRRFDLKKIRARMILNGFPPFSPVKVIDTLEIAKGVFGFTSNKLEWMSTYLGRVKKRKHEKFPGFELWKECLLGNVEAWEEMRLYNIDDVVSLREVWLELRPWADKHPNLAAYYPDEQMRCGKCGSAELSKAGTTFTDVGEYARYCCDNCGGFSRSRYTLNTIGKRRNLLTSQ